MPGPALAPFAPNVAASVTITVATTSAADALVGSGQEVRIASNATIPVFINFGTSAAAAAVATGTCVMPGTVEVLRRPASATHIATIKDTDSGTQKIYVSTGEGS